MKRVHLLLASVAMICAGWRGAAAMPDTATRVIVSDGFEAGIVKSVTRDPHGNETGFRLHAPVPRLRCMLPVVDPSGKAGLFQHAGGAGTSGKSVRMQNSPDVKVGHTPALSWWPHQLGAIRSGELKINFDLMVPSQGGSPLTVIVRNFQPREDSLSLTCGAEKASLKEQECAVTPDEWVHYAVTVPAGVSEGTVTVRVVDPKQGEQRLQASFTSKIQRMDWVLFCLFGNTDGYVLLDNLQIEVDGEAPVAETAPAPTRATKETAWRATPAAVLDVFPDSVVSVPESDQGKTVQSSTYSPTGSSWAEGLDERWVFHHEMRHDQDEHNSFRLRIGKGGQLYSLRGVFGESIPPQGKGNPWNDEVWQFVSVCPKYNGNLLSAGPLPADVTERIKRSPYARTYFIHNSGAYIPGDSGLNNLYCPLLGASVPRDGRTYRTVNWGLVPQVKTVHRSPILYYVQTRDVGDGVIEITYVVHNFSVCDDIVFDWLNAPWGGTRKRRLPDHCLSKPDGSLMDRQTMATVAGAIDVRETGGWNLSSVSEASDSPALALVFGRDRHLEAEQERAAKGQPHIQKGGSIYRYMNADGGYDWWCQDWETRPENSFRNYDVAVVIPKLDLKPRATIWYRSYLVVNRRDRAIELAKSLVDKVDYGLVTFDPATTPLVPVAIRKGHVVKRGWFRKPTFMLFAKPVPGTMPLFLIENAETGREVITTDPYVFVPKEKLDLGIPPEHPHHDYYKDACGYSLDENNSNWKRLLGYAYVEKPVEGSFSRLSDIVGPKMSPAPDTYHIDLWVEPGK